MELDACIEKRQSQRKFLDKELPIEVIAKIVKAGTMSPNAGNLQALRFIIITDSKAKEKVAMACEEQLWMCEAGALIAICSDLRDIELDSSNAAIQQEPIPISVAFLQRKMLQLLQRIWS